MNNLPGYRFAPTEYELVGFYLRAKAEDRKLEPELIAVVDFYKYDPWELPDMAIKVAPLGQVEWFFFVPRHHKYPNGSRPNRVTKSGYWKATGTDRPVMDKENTNCIGLKKTLVFYIGKAPHGERTPWVMNEFRLPDEQSAQSKNEFTLCKIYKKSGSGAWNAPGTSHDAETGSPVFDSDEASPSDAKEGADEEMTGMAAATAALDQTRRIQELKLGDEEEKDSNVMFSGFEDIEHLNPPAAWGYNLSNNFQWNT